MASVVAVALAVPATAPRRPTPLRAPGPGRWRAGSWSSTPVTSSGNHNFPRRIHRLVPAGGFRKPCNTTGTATNGGYPEASLTWDVALRARASGCATSVRSSG